MIKNPRNFARREIRIQQQSGSCCDIGFMALISQRFANMGGAPVLPDNRVIDRHSTGAVPDDGRLTLVGDADDHRRLIGLRQDFLRDGQDRRPDRFGIMFHPALSRIVLGEFLLGDMQRLTLVVEYDCAGTGCALINRKNRGCRCHKRMLIEAVSVSILSDRALGAPPCRH